MIPQDFLKNITKRLGISETELEALQEAIQGQSVDAIAQQLDVTKEAIQKRLGEVYKKFQIEGKGPGKLTKLQQQLMEEYQKYLDQFGQFTAPASQLSEITPLATMEVEDLSPSETEILYILAIAESPLGLDQIQKAFTSGDLSELLMALASLLKQYLVEQITRGEATQFIVALTMKQWILYQCKQYQISLENITFEQYPTIYKQLAQALSQKGWDYYAQGEFASAKFNLKLATNLDSNLAIAHYHLALVYEQLQKLSLARAHYETAALTKNLAHLAMCNLSRLDILEGNTRQGIDRIMSMLDTVKDEGIKANLAKNLGWAYYLEGNYQQAADYLTESLKLNPNQPVTHCLMAQLLEAQGKHQEALTYWENGLKDEVMEGKNWQSPELIILRSHAYFQLRN